MDLLDFHKKIKGYTQEKQPGSEKDMDPRPIAEMEEYKAGGKLKGKVALITGGDSGIGRSVAILYAKEGADVAIGYYNEHEDAEDTVNRLKEIGVKAKAYSHDLKDADQSKKLVETVVTTSVTAYRGSGHLIDYSATKGAIVSFTRSIATSLMEKGIRVNGVAPGPIYTPLIPSTFDEDKVENQGGDTPMGRRGQPAELAPAYVFLASYADSSYITGQIIHVNGGDYITS